MFLLLRVISEKVTLIIFPYFIREFCRKGWTHAVSEIWRPDLDSLPPLSQIYLGEGSYEKNNYLFTLPFLSD